MNDHRYFSADKKAAGGRVPGKRPPMSTPRAAAVCTRAHTMPSYVSPTLLPPPPCFLPLQSVTGAGASNRGKRFPTCQDQDQAAALVAAWGRGGG